jgi:N-acyl-L-homoserine lactone synthetase
MKIKSASNEYLEKAANLTDDEGERLLSRMRGKLTRRFEDEKLSKVEAIAIQLELDDEQLAEWRERMHEIKAKDKSKK